MRRKCQLDRMLVKTRKPLVIDFNYMTFCAALLEMNPLNIKREQHSPKYELFGRIHIGCY